MTDELLYESDRTRVARVTVGSGSAAVRKETLGPGAARRLRHELGILQRLAGAPGVPRLLGPPDQAEAILVEDVRGQPLTAVLARGPLEVDEVVDVAAELAHILAEVHRRGVLHKDINPANILLWGVPRRPMLIDFGLSTTFAEERPGFTHHKEIIGTPAYLAPEQTGRTGWPVDHRADLYALGATLYELATGTPPFGDGDLLDLIRDHLTREPAPAHEVNPAVPATLSAIIAHLLEKEPDRRYQSAEAVRRDLSRLRDERARGVASSFQPGARDFPWRLTPPTRLTGRAAEGRVLVDGFAEAAAGGFGAVLISGQPGVGKTALIDGLRPTVSAAGGWFLAGKFDQFRRGPDATAMGQLTRALARMFLAEPEAELRAVRDRLRDALGANAGLLVAAVPELQPLLAVPATAATEPAVAPARLHLAALELLATAAGRDRPVVIVFDDLQWADAASIGFIDALMTAERHAGVLLVGAYRESEVDSSHPLTPMLGRWARRDDPPRRLRLANLCPAELRNLLAEMLRMPPERIAPLAEAVAARTRGNPFDAVELLNAWRAEGALVPGEDGWSWDPVALRDDPGGDVLDLLAARVAALPAATRELIEAVACLGGEVRLDLLSAAARASASDVDAWLLPALEDGLLVLERGRAISVRFRHDRVQQAAYGRIPPRRRAGRHLLLARRLADTHPLPAAEQYLAAVGELSAPDERRTAARLLRAAAGHARNVGNNPLVERYLAAAAELVAANSAAASPVDPEDARLRQDLDVERHAALNALGRFADVDTIFDRIQRDNDDRYARAEAARVQVSSLLIRGRPRDAVALGLRALADLGHPAPEPEALAARIDEGWATLTGWAGSDDPRRPPPARRRQVDAVARIINRLIPAAYFSLDPVMPWLIIEAARIWRQDGPSAALVGPLAHAAFVTTPREDYATGYAVVRRVLRAAERHGFESELPQARLLSALSATPWFEPLEESVRQSRRAREALVRGGDLQNACFSYFVTTPQLFDCAPTLDDVLADAEAALALADRTGNGFLAAAVVAYRQAVRTLRGETEVLGHPDDAGFHEAEHLAGANPNAAANYHLVRAATAAIFDDQAALSRHAAAAAPLRPVVEATQAVTLMHLVRGLAAAGRLRAGTDRDAALRELDGCREWLARRAAESPANFLHLRRLVDAERAWALGDAATARDAFDRARRQVGSLRRPWQHALIVERFALFHLSDGAAAAGRVMLAEAARRYRDWGAAGKVRQLVSAHPFLAAGAGRSTASGGGYDQRVPAVTTDTVDMLAVLRASQALSSETHLGSLQRRVREVLAALTGATAVHILLRDAGTWVVPGAGDGEGLDLRPPAPARLPMSLVRYVERTREALLVEDATMDDRFNRDPYLREAPPCSLMAVPILGRGELTAMLVLENRNRMAVLDAYRLETVLLIAGQLSVSLDNALLYAELERKVAERTEALREANERLELLAVTDPLTGLANRRRLTDTLEAEWRRSLRTGAPLAVALIDIDHFKHYNDHYGHVAGDECLRRVAAAIARSSRETDLVARYGGEEFIVVLPGVDAVTAGAAAERIRAGVVALSEPHRLGETGIITVSVGVASTVASPLDSVERLVKTADAALYDAKRGGRNRVCGGHDRSGR